MALISFSKSRVKKAAREAGGGIYAPGQAAIRRAFDRYVEKLQAGAKKMSDTELIEHIEDLPWNDAEKILNDAWSEMAEATAGKGFEEGKDLLDLPSDQKRGIRFDMKNPLFESWARTQSTKAIQQVSETTRAAVQDVILDGFERGRTPADISRSIRGFRSRKDGTYYPGVIGLTAKDAGAVEKYKANLLSHDLDPSRANKLAERYRKILLTSRGNMIAQTETLTALAAGKRIAWEQAENEGLILSTSVRVWETAFDERTCSTCSPLHRTTAPINGTFPGGIESEPAHPRCRCTTSIITIVPGMTRKLPTPPSQMTLDQQAERRAAHIKAQAAKRRKLLRPPKR